MKVRNALYRNIENTLVDVEIEHPQYGWIPYTFKYGEKDTSFDSEIREYLETASIEKFVEPIQTAEEILAEKVAEAKAYLASTDFKMTVDYYATLLDDEKSELTRKRAEAREFIRSNDVSVS